MTAPPPGPPTPRTDLVWRTGVVVAGAGTSLLGGPPTLTGTLGLAGVVLAAERLATLRRLPRVDTVALAVVATVMALLLVGLALVSTPLGLGRTPWTLTLAALSLLGLALSAVRPPPTRPSRGWTRADTRAALRTGPWLVVAAAAGVALSTSTGTLDLGTPVDPEPSTAAGPAARTATTPPPPTATTATTATPTATRPTASGEGAGRLTFGRIDGTRVPVVISGGGVTGPVEVRTASGDGEVSYPLVGIDPRTPTSVELTLPRHGRFTITVNTLDQTLPLATLVLDR